MPLTRGRGLDHKMATSQTPPGAPGIPSRWTSSAKSGVGTALSSACRIWFTISHGILNEVYYPRVDHACTRDLGLIVCGPDGYFSEEKRHADHLVQPFEEGVAAYRLVNTALDGRFRIEKRILVDPTRPAVLAEDRVHAARRRAGRLSRLCPAGPASGQWRRRQHRPGSATTRARTCSSPRGAAGRSLALASSLPWKSRSAGFVGVSDGWQQLSARGSLDPAYERAENGNVALTGEIGFSADAREAVAGARLRPRPRGGRLQCRCQPEGGVRRGGRSDWSPAGAAGKGRCCRSIARPHRLRRTPIASAPPSWPPIVRWPFRAPRSPACRSPGASARATRTSAATISSGRATWSRPRAASWPPAPPATPWPSSPICAPSRRPTGTGRRMPGSTAPPTGTASRWTNAPSRSCSPRRSIAARTCPTPPC